MDRPATERPSLRAPAQPPLVLVVDDDPNVLKICTTVLEAGGYRTATASSGPEALERVDALKPDLVVLDLVMPGGDGFTAAHMIRSRPAGARTPILVLTGTSMSREDAARRAGATKFCMKPLDPSRFMVEVRKLCPMGGSAPARPRPY